ncbi:tRNA (5-methylaminomethyl-2-thiouridine)(34)-methyltransferase MnmD [Aureivirga sp. CE67]|uniref:tRNA (5-methylaminomethyl-2-thiouridine)(34)-methyltransferase MnmD n=1 Tax=Aureivirga sp. CE67 TaxID=1788983 RepID=UPI0018CA0DB7|nr:tRNA (5-methylaminomethyl-2-thiouridine)(34)-methyltransferase MnmD [Aureivirga sp. CE67]
MERKIIKTGDGSTTIHIPEWNEQYHSKHGAIQEAYHVFIKHGFEICDLEEISILEIGFGTGLNCFITYLESLKNNKKIQYTGVEAYPVAESIVKELNYPEILDSEKYSSVFDKMHSISWNEKHQISDAFELEKQEKKFQDISDSNAFDLIYFDAFGARVQPELWTEQIFESMYKALKDEGILVTYSAKGSVRRAMQAVGFLVEKLPGPPGKREMLRGIKKTL